MSLPSVATQVVLKKSPTGFINPAFNQPDSTFAIKHVSFPKELQKGQLVLKDLYLSNDPTQRSWIRSKDHKIRYYSKRVDEGNAMESYGLGKIVQANSDRYKVGQIIYARIQWGDYSIIEETDVYETIDTSLGFPLEYFLSVLGMTSLTAFFGLTEAGGLKKYLNSPKNTGPIVSVSAASGAVGSIVVEIAKNLLGASKVIGIAGSDEKCKWVESLGADLCVNYKDPDYQEKITAYLGDKEIDTYFDNVGGEILSYMLTKIRKFGHVVACGSISGYNNPEAALVANWGQITGQSIRVQGFIVYDYKDQFPDAYRILTEAVKSGKISTKDAYHVEKLHGHDLIQRLEGIPVIWNQLYQGNKPAGKLITQIAPDA
ncbi:hypothetical protein SBY92_001530 [Candida maltosa Xu316]|uniref:Zinc-binding alcohol dehydrogenase, putative (Oxidoreductase, putative) n=1 Tax=Candida maltosa (strain Xu316) TaxID=1245528 RepID=M3IVT4_CANMX|nr:Zinc-binding alcohol dehydrogenase, putative (Oxidoreductase, putative) [Candida maltosa Xu316]